MQTIQISNPRANTWTQPALPTDGVDGEGAAAIGSRLSFGGGNGMRGTRDRPPDRHHRLTPRRLGEPAG